MTGRIIETTDRGKADLLDASASLDASGPVVRQLAAAVCGANTTKAEAVRRALLYCQRKIAYAGDTRRKREAVAKYGEAPNHEELADTLTIVRKQHDDCDGKARVLVAFLRARGIEARIRPVWQAIGGFTHVQAECRYPGSETHRLAQNDGWLVLEPTAREAEVGEGPADVQRRTGRLLVHEF